MDSKVQKLGNSVGIKIPKKILEKSKIKMSTKINIDFEENKTIILPKNSPFYLKTMLPKIMKKNLHKEINWKPEGKEVW